jgi:sugar phosphate isomerase/epimerase
LKLGFLTSCLPRQSLPEIAAWAAGNGFDALEVAAWPATSSRPGTAAHLDVAHLDGAAGEQTLALLDAHALSLSALAYYDNNLHPDRAERERANQHVIACIDAAARLGCSNVGTFIGRDPSLTVTKNLRTAEQVFAPLVDHAADRGVRLLIENCVMEGWHPDGHPGNLAYSPELWEWMFSIGLYLNYDPSHLVWMGIDPTDALEPYTDRVAHVQAKDIELFPAARTRYGWPGKAVTRNDPWDVGWWRYRIPGHGQIDWSAVIDVLARGGFDGAVSIEHEDPDWGGTEDLVQQGLQLAHRTLRPIVRPRQFDSGRR